MKEEIKTVLLVIFILSLVGGTALTSLIILPTTIDFQIEKGYIQNSQRETFKVLKTSEYIQLKIKGE